MSAQTLTTTLALAVAAALAGCDAPTVPDTTESGSALTIEHPELEGVSVVLRSVARAPVWSPIPFLAVVQNGSDRPVEGLGLVATLPLTLPVEAAFVDATQGSCELATETTVVCDFETLHEQQELVVEILAHPVEIGSTGEGEVHLLLRGEGAGSAPIPAVSIWEPFPEAERAPIPFDPDRGVAPAEPLQFDRLPTREAPIADRWPSGVSRVD
jgi:hypothetical protein